ncbi:Uncharacterized protein ALO83_04865 [Pseudomonas cannabina pv. alisalensis]|nr:Uncharacterized protein ALO83_04865 [Pseudomonas cannabina pv. alisalensis]
MLTRSHGNRATGIQQVEGVRGLENHFVSRQRQFQLDQARGFAFVKIEQFEQFVDVGVFEVVGRLLHLVLVEHIAVGHFAERAVSPDQIVDRVHALLVHRQTLEAVSDFAGDRVALQAADLLEVGELRDFHAVEPDFPAQPPGAQSRRFPVVFDKTHVMHQRIEADVFERAQVQFLEVVRVRLENHLKLVVMLQAVRILAVTAVSRATAWLYVSGIPGFRAYGAQKRGSVERAGAYFHIVGLKYHATLFCPVLLEGEDQVLEGTHGWRRLAHKFHLCWAAIQRAGVYPIRPHVHSWEPYDTLLLVQRRPPVHRISRSGVGSAAARCAEALRVAFARRVPGGAVVDHDSQASGALPRGAAWLRCRAACAIERRRNRSVDA